VTVGSDTYTFVASNATAAGQVVIAANNNIAQTLTNLANSIGGTAGATNTEQPLANTNVTASVNGDALTVTSDTAGTAGNGLIGFSASISHGFGTFSGLDGNGDLTGGQQPDTVTIGAETYTFVASGNATNAGDVAINAGSVHQTLVNLKNAVNNGSSGSPTTYGSGMGANPAATVAVTGDVATVTATVSSSATAAPTVAFSASGTILTYVSGTGDLTGGVNATPASAVVSLNTNPSVGNTLTLAGETYTFVAAGGATAANEVALGNNTNAATALLNTMVNLEEAVDGYTATGIPGVNSYGVNTGTNTNVQIPSGTNAGAPTVSNGVGTFTVQAITPGVAGNSLSIIANLTNGVGGVVGSGMSGGGGYESLMTATNAQTTLVAIEGAISQVALDRGTIGGGINQMNAALDVINNTSQELTSSLSGIEDANIGQVISNMSKYQVLEQTGIAALAQSNTSEQAVLRLLP
jgi:flagellin